MRAGEFPTLRPGGVLGALVVLAAVLVACEGQGAPTGPDAAPTTPPRRVAGLELEVYEDDRLSFVYPEDWDLEVAEGDEQRVRVEKREDGAEYAEAVIVASWPSLAAVLESNLERMVRQFGREPGDPAITDFGQEPIEVPGATDAVLQIFTNTDAVVGEETEARTWGVLAISEVGRPVYLVVSVMQDSDVDADVLAQAVTSSLELKNPWGSPEPPRFSP